MINGILPFQYLGQHFRCEMKYDESDPYAFHFVFRHPCQEGDCTDPHETTWTLARELISEGLESETGVGIGDVMIRRDSHNTVYVTLQSPEGTAILSVPRQPLKEFLKLSYSVVDSGQESAQYDWDKLDKERVSW